MPPTSDDRSEVRRCFLRYAEKRGFKNTSRRHSAFIVIINTAKDDNVTQDQYGNVQTVLGLLKEKIGDDIAFAFFDIWYPELDPEPIADGIALRYLGELSPERVRELAQDHSARSIAIGSLDGVKNLPPGPKEEVVKYTADACRRYAGILIKSAEEGGLKSNQLMVLLRDVDGNPANLQKIIKNGGVAIAVTCLAYEGFVAIKDWYDGKISGMRAARDVTAATLSSIGSLAGANIGATVGAAAGGPCGASFGSMLGAVFCSMAGTGSADLLFRKFFNLPKERAVENAYKTLGVQFNAPATEINAAYRALALLHHPDRDDGNEVRFREVCSAVELIRHHDKNA